MMRHKGRGTWATLALALVAVASVATSCVPETPEDTGAPDAASVTVQGGRPILQIGTGSIGFGAVACGGKADTQRVVVSNAGDAPLEVDASILGTGFALDGAAHASIEPGGTASIAIRATDVQADAVPGVAISGKLHLVTNDPTHPDLQLPLSVTPTGALLQVSATSLGLAGPGQGSAQLTFTNQGNAPVDLTLQAGSPFHVGPSLHVPASGSATAQVDFTSNEDATGQLTIQTQGAVCGAPPAGVALSAHSVPNGVPYVSVTKLDFGPVDCGVAETQTFELVNGSDAPISFTGQTNTGSFNVSPSSGTLQPQERVTVTATATVTQTPDTVATGKLTFATSPVFTGNLSVDVSGTAHGALLAVQPSSLAFTTPVSQAASQPFQITNSGNGPAVVTLNFSGDPSFSASTPSLSVSPSPPASVTVTFQSAVSGTFQGSIGFVASPLCGPAPPALTLTGTAMDTADAGTTDTGIDAAIDVIQPDIIQPDIIQPDVIQPDVVTMDAAPDTFTFDVIVNDVILIDP